MISPKPPLFAANILEQSSFKWDILMPVLKVFRSEIRRFKAKGLQSNELSGCHNELHSNPSRKQARLQVDGT